VVIHVTGSGLVIDTEMLVPRGFVLCVCVLQTTVGVRLKLHVQGWGMHQAV
ncbi:hypothetical protein A2U01_0092545, partial [Trifolium medium]|nr:hypothetical protein [Trifolium medium]